MARYYPPEYQEEIRGLIDRLRSQPLLKLGLAMLRKRRTPPLSPPSSLLDIGCSHGDYLSFLQKAGWEVEGIELDPQAARHAQEAGLRVHQGDAEELLERLPSGRYNVVTMWHVLEHLYDPLGALREVYRILKPDGLLLLELPNSASVLARCLGRYWYPLEVPRHLYHFTPTTLSNMLGAAGFRVCAIEGVPSPEVILWSLRLLKNRVRPSAAGTPMSHPLVVNPLLAALCFPPSWLLANIAKGDHMSVRARKDEQRGTGEHR